jgi:hypothetical protein
VEVKDKILATLKERQKAVQYIFTPDFNKFLIKYSIFRIKTIFNINYDLNRGFRGIMIEDIINDLMLSFIKEDARNWNKANFSNFKDQVLSALDSQISNTIGKEFKKVKLTTEINDTIKIESDNCDNYNDLLDFSLKVLGDLGATDDELLLFEPYVINKMKRKDIAHEYGISEQEASNIKKRIERKLPKLRQQITNLEL